MAGLTALAVAAVAFLAYQASANVPADLASPKKPGSSASGAPAAKEKKKDAHPVPAASGSGQRVVYALGAKRVWLVAKAGQRPRTFGVMPSTVSPPPGTYEVTSRSGQITGSDGVDIEHVVRFASVGQVAIGFSAAVDGTMPSPDPGLRTGGVRMTPADGDALWAFAPVGSKVVVVP
ncbi:L,D-transpeptidase [Streptomyces sp. NPDC058653]|uniref:L,D-transpeptidase n=1 Tax=Streptomyces sp. NPDC058653 TaxID=3346576 RepID=UPI0036560C25